MNRVDLNRPVDMAEFLRICEASKGMEDGQRAILIRKISQALEPASEYLQEIRMFTGTDQDEVNRLEAEKALMEDLIVYLG